MRIFVVIMLLIPAIGWAGHTEDEVEIRRIVVIFQAMARHWAPLASTSGEILPMKVLQRVGVEFGDMDGSDRAVAACRVGSGHDPRVVVNPVHWAQYTHWEREQILFHEFGHCMLNRKHDARMILRSGEKIPVSVMNPNVIDEQTYLLNRDYYHEELFKNVLSTPVPGQVLR